MSCRNAALRFIERLGPILGVVAGANPTWATPTVRGSEAEILSEARRLHTLRQHDDALDLLKAAQAAAPASEQLTLELAQTYVKKENFAWALRSLSRYLEDHGPSCSVRLALAWLQMQQGQKYLAQQLLDQAGCTSPPEIQARRLLYTAYLDLLEGRRARAIELIQTARKSDALFEEDEALLNYMTTNSQPERMAMVTGLVDFAHGWTSHGLAGSPVDQTAQQSSGTAITIFDARLRLMPVNTGGVRPLVEGQLRAQQLWSDETSSMSFRTGTARAGLLLGKDAPRLLALAAMDATQTQGGDRYSGGPLWFSEAQRGEVELELPGAVFLMLGAGRRNFREAVRTRTEVDGTIGWAAQRQGLRFLGGISARYHNATIGAYDLVGATIVSQVRFSLPLGIEARATLSTSLDNYYRSQGYFSSAAPSARRDTQWRAITALYTPPLFALVRLGAKYDLSMRRSSAGAYEYTDHRFLAELEWQIDSDHLGRTVVSTRGRAAADYGELGGSGDTSSTQLRELIRQEENQRRSSTCLK